MKTEVVIHWKFILMNRHLDQWTRKPTGPGLIFGDDVPPLMKSLDLFAG
ncbi:hypothetical protein [uncultured Cohaesibacter sp.]|nr:hypothetical protein [uncultured Cohaesibacter sp.]